MSDVIVPFGKYKGKLVQETLTDKEYWEYLMTQAWFKEKFVNIYNIVQNVGHEPTETPEHNRLQIMFLDEKFIRSFYEHIGLHWISEHPPKVNFEMKKPIGHNQHGLVYGPPIDVFIGSDSWGARGSAWIPEEAERQLWIEVKPTVGDDYPAILRQMKNSGARVLLTEKYIGQGATLEQVRAFFATSGKRVILLEEVLKTEKVQ